ncbi:hypothetical protein BJX99DRAFT_226656 [Aspergillus californicus]
MSIGSTSTMVCATVKNAARTLSALGGDRGMRGAKLTLSGVCSMIIQRRALGAKEVMIR